MKLKNYTSDVDASASMAKIEKLLVEAGATDISKSYKEGVCTSFKFRIMVNLTPLFFELPANVDACFTVMYKEITRPREDTKSRIKEQAAKTAWKIISDLIEVQLSMIQLKQAEVLQIFLPYVYNPQQEKTLYQQIKDGDFKLLEY